MKMKYDVVVVGSGPAGSVTARFAADGGAKVLVIERRAEVGVPVLCGEGISRKIDDWDIIDGKRWIAGKMDGARIYSPDKTYVTLAAEKAGNETGYVIYRDIFDQELASRAIKAGATFMMNAKAVGIIKDGDKIKGIKAEHFDEELEIECDIIVAADGVDSKVAQWAGINTKLNPKDLETCCQYTLTDIDIKDAYCEFYLGKEIAPGGYIWVFPKGKRIANVGIGILASLSESGMAKKLLDRFIENDPRLNKGKSLRFLAGAVPVSNPAEQTVADNIVLVGDAARHVDPITGGGLTHCLEGGKIAGNVIAKAVKKKEFSAEFLSEYEKGWKEAFGQKIKRNYLVKELLLEMDDKTFNKLAHALEKVKFDEISTHGLVKEVAKHLPISTKLNALIKHRKKIKELKKK
jgi:digeranylgeranylglycerophospholipid reductase